MEAVEIRFMTKNSIGDFALVGTKLVLASASSGNEQWEVAFGENHEVYALLYSRMMAATWWLGQT